MIKHPFLKILIVNKQLKDISVKDRNTKKIAKHQNTSTVKFKIKTNCTVTNINQHYSGGYIVNAMKQKNEVRKRETDHY